jgi:hypothetical protein
MDVRWNGNGSEEGGIYSVETLFLHLSGGTEENYNNLRIAGAVANFRTEYI